MYRVVGYDKLYLNGGEGDLCNGGDLLSYCRNSLVMFWIKSEAMGQ